MTNTQGMDRYDSPLLWRVLEEYDRQDREDAAITGYHAITTLPGEPEGGMQATLDGGCVEYHPKGAGRRVQISMDDQLKMSEYITKAKEEKRQ